MSTTLERLEYGFDRDSRRTWRKRSLTTGEDNAYGYDGLSQVVNAARGNLNLNATAIGGVPAETQTWDYDPTGNWRGYETQISGGVALDQTRVHDKGNRLTQIVGAPNPVLLDRAGRMREVAPDATGNWNQSQKITWDAWSRVVRIEQNGTTTGSYAYDGLTRRTTRTAGGATWHSYYSDAWRPLEERRDSQTVPARQYYWGARHRDDLVRRDRATTSGGPLNETRYVLMDYFSPAAITDGSGAVKERYALSAFGVRRILTPAFGDRATSECDFTFAFQGQFLDTESGFLNYGYRYYSPDLGRWLSRDPVQEGGGLNLYSFLANNSVNAADYLGLQNNTCPCRDDDINRLADEYTDKAAQHSLDDLSHLPPGGVRVYTAPNGETISSTGREWGGFVCCDPQTGTVSATGPEPAREWLPFSLGGGKFIYSGQKIKLEDLQGCPSNTKKVAFYHSHPSGDANPGKGDLGAAWFYELPVFTGTGARTTRLDRQRRDILIKTKYGYGIVRNAQSGRLSEIGSDGEANPIPFEPK